MENNRKRGQGSCGLQSPYNNKKNAKLLKIIEREGLERNRLLPVLKNALLYKHSCVVVELTTKKLRL
jgi:hypothetical protein